MRLAGPLLIGTCLALGGVRGATVHGKAPARPQAIKLKKAQIAAVVHNHLHKNEKVAHAVFRGAFGPARDAVLVICEREGSPFSGFVLAGGKRIPLPLLDDLVESWTADSVNALVLEDLDADGAIEPIIMTSYMTGIGPTGAQPFNHNYVLDWDTKRKRFVRLKKLEKRVGALTSARAIRVRLNLQRAPRRSKPVIGR